MKTLNLMLLIMAFVISGCHTSRQAANSTPVIITNTDSIRTEYIETVRLDTVIVEVKVPEESVSQVVRDTMSHIETTLAESDAWINKDGSLGHSIKNKLPKIKSEVPVPVKETMRNNTASSVREVPVPKPYPVYVEREFTSIEWIKLKAFWYLVGIVGLSVVWIFRIPILSVIRKMRHC